MKTKKITVEENLSSPTHRQGYNLLILEELKKLIDKHPDHTFGQIMKNFCPLNSFVESKTTYEQLIRLYGDNK